MFLFSMQVAFTGNYTEYFGLATDVDAVVYLMLVNDVIHGLFPEAVSIGEDVCHRAKHPLYLPSHFLLMQHV